MNDLRRSLLFFYTETPLHAGSGAGLGAIDLPLQRERMSDLPQVQGSGIKGAMRELFRARSDERYEDDKEQDPQRQKELRVAHAQKCKEHRILEEALFGPRPPDPVRERAKGNDGRAETDPQAQEHAGALAVTDARLLLMPIRSAHGGWAWITSPLILQRLARDLGYVGNHDDEPKWATLTTDSGTALVSGNEVAIAPKGNVVLEDSLYEAKQNREVTALAEVLVQFLPEAKVYDPIKKRLASQLAVISDEEMCYWAKHGTEVVTRVRIDDETGTVEDGALWTEEVLPSESLLWSMVMITDSRQRADKGFVPRRATGLDDAFRDELAERPRIFLGGDRTVGRGLVALKLERVEKGGGDVQAK